MIIYSKLIWPFTPPIFSSNTKLPFIFDRFRLIQACYRQDCFALRPLGWPIKLLSICSMLETFKTKLGVIYGRLGALSSKSLYLWLRCSWLMTRWRNLKSYSQLWGFRPNKTYHMSVKAHINLYILRAVEMNSLLLPNSFNGAMLYKAKS